MDGDGLDEALLVLNTELGDVPKEHGAGQAGDIGNQNEIEGSGDSLTRSAMARRATDMLTLRRSLMIEAEII